MYLKIIRAALVVVLSLFPAVATAEEREDVDLLLCLAADISGSVSKHEAAVQRIGHAMALNSAPVLDAITRGPLGRIAVTFVEWAGVGEQQTVIDWMIVDGPLTALQFAKRMDNASHPSFNPGNGYTSISGAIEFCLNRFDDAPYDGLQHVIDITGDGTENYPDGGTDTVRATRDNAVFRGVTINSLVILDPNPPPPPSHTNPKGGLLAYFRNNVIGGFSAFTETVQDSQTFEEAIKNKMKREIIASR